MYQASICWNRIKNPLKIVSGFIISISLIGLMICLAKDIEIANRVESFFNQDGNVVFLSIRDKKFEKIGLPITVSYAKQQQIFVLQLGSVSKTLCQRLVQTNIPFPHQFWVDGNPIDSLNLDLCYKSTPRFMSLQFATNFRSFAHELTADMPCQCDKPFISYGMCTGNCLHYSGCRQTPVCKWKNEEEK